MTRTARHQHGLASRWVLALLAALALGWWMSGEAGYDPGPGVVAPAVPVQGPVSGTPPTQIGRFRLIPLHDFTVEARVLGSESYRFDDQAEIAPIDLALGWGRMSDSSVLEQLSISQGGRFYHYRWGAEGPPIPAEEIVRSSANMHLVPANPEIEDMLRDIVPGQVVRLQGWLVMADRGDGWKWMSSTRREDSGNGACELVLVQSVAITTP